MTIELLTLVTILLYLALLFVVAWRVGGGSDNASFFSGGRRQPSWVVALSMVGAPMTGITFISVPGAVGQGAFSYLQMVFGFVVGSVIIAYWLIPLYYRYNVTSLYEYLERRFGVSSHRGGAWLFLISKLLGSALKTFVVCIVIQQLLCRQLGIPFWVTVAVFMALVWLYTHRGGVGTVVWIDAVKTVCMVLCVVLSILFIAEAIGLPVGEAINTASQRGVTQVLFVEDWRGEEHFVKMFLSGIFMIVAMTGLDQDMMQRALSSRSLRSAQRNMVLASLLQMAVIVLLLVLGALLYLYLANSGQAVAKPDETFAFVATREGMPVVILILLVLGVLSATFSSTAGALTSLTTSFTVDILRDKGLSVRAREAVHLAIAMVLIVLILAFDRWSNDSTINLVYRLASYSYGPLLGMFAFGVLSKRSVRDGVVGWVLAAAPVLSLLCDINSERWFGGYRFGFEILLVNAAFTMVGLLLISHRSSRSDKI